MTVSVYGLFEFTSSNSAVLLFWNEVVERIRGPSKCLLSKERDVKETVTEDHSTAGLGVQEWMGCFGMCTRLVTSIVSLAALRFLHWKCGVVVTYGIGFEYGW